MVTVCPLKIIKQLRESNYDDGSNEDDQSLEAPIGKWSGNKFTYSYTHVFSDAITNHNFSLIPRNSNVDKLTTLDITLLKDAFQNTCKYTQLLCKMLIKSGKRNVVTSSPPCIVVSDNVDILSVNKYVGAANKFAKFMKDLRYDGISKWSDEVMEVVTLLNPHCTLMDIEQKICSIMKLLYVIQTRLSTLINDS
jgi:alpha-N-acetylglucosamine transferase